MKVEYGSIANRSEREDDASGDVALRAPGRRRDAAAVVGDEAPAAAGDDDADDIGSGIVGTKRSTVRYLSSASGEIMPQYLDEPDPTGRTSPRDEWEGRGGEEFEPLVGDEARDDPGECSYPKQKKVSLSFSGSKSLSSEAARSRAGSPPPPSVSSEQHDRAIAFSSQRSIVTFASEGGQDDDDDGGNNVAERTRLKKNSTASVITEPGDVAQRKGTLAKQLLIFLALIVTPFVALHGVLTLVKYLKGGGNDDGDGDAPLENFTGPSAAWEN